MFRTPLLEKGPMRPLPILARRPFLWHCLGLLAPFHGIAAGQERKEPPFQSQGNPKPGKIIDFLEKELKDGSFPGAGLVVSKNGKQVFQHFLGKYLDNQGKEHSYRPSVTSTFYSFSKGISATVAMVAQDKGQLSLDDLVIKHIPEFATGDKDKINLRQLLTHSAGIPGAPTPFQPVRTDQEWNQTLETMCRAKLEWQPGSKTAYHPFVHLLVGEVVRRRNRHRSWDSLCREWLFSPLQAPSLTFGPPENPNLHTWAPRDSQGSDQIQKMLDGHPAGGCKGTLEDGLKILELHLNQGQWKTQTVLSRAAHGEMHTVQFDWERKSALAKNQTPVHEPWAVGWLMRGDGPTSGAQAWFGFRDLKDPQVFGHAGIDTIIGVANPKTGIALVFNVTQSPKTAELTTRLRNSVTNLVMDAFSSP